MLTVYLDDIAESFTRHELSSTTRLDVDRFGEQPDWGVPDDMARTKTIELEQMSSWVYPKTDLNPISIANRIEDPAGDKNLHTSYIIPWKVFPKRLGSFIYTGGTNWSDIEHWCANLFGLHGQQGINGRTEMHITSDSRNRNIDYQRKCNTQFGVFWQSIEVKKVSGHHTRAPCMIRSSRKQLRALVNYRHKEEEAQMYPALFCIVSVDNLALKQDDGTIKRHRINTVWLIPVISEDDFVSFETERQAIDYNRNNPRTARNRPGIDVRTRTTTIIPTFKYNEHRNGP